MCNFSDKRYRSLKDDRREVFVRHEKVGKERCRGDVSLGLKSSVTMESQNHESPLSESPFPKLSLK